MKGARNTNLETLEKAKNIQVKLNRYENLLSHLKVTIEPTLYPQPENQCFDLTTEEKISAQGVIEDYFKGRIADLNKELAELWKQLN